MVLNEILEGSRHKLFNRTGIIYHSTMKSAKCEYQIPINNNENIGQIIKCHVGGFLASNCINSFQEFSSPQNQNFSLEGY